MVFHSTEIMKIRRDGLFILDCEGHRSATTKSRINQYSPIQIYQKGHVWWVDGMVLGEDETDAPFWDGMIVNWNGNIVCPVCFQHGDDITSTWKWSGVPYFGGGIRGRCGVCHDQAIDEGKEPG